MDKVITQEQLAELAKYMTDVVLPNRLYEVRKTAMDILEILGIKITLE